MIWNLNKIYYFLYELALLLVFYVLIMTPLHMVTNRHYNINGTFNPSSFTFTALNPSFISVGDYLPIYRFQPQVPSEIGWAKVSSIQDRKVTASADLSQVRLPIGNHGRIIEVNQSMVKVSMGSVLGLKSGDLLCLFKDRSLVGKVQLQNVEQEYSWAKVISLSQNTRLEEVSVSEYSVATQVVIFKNLVVTLLEVVFFLFILVIHFYFFIFRKTPLLTLLGHWFRRQHQRLPQPFSNYLGSIVLGIPFVWFVVNFFPQCFIYLCNSVIALINPIFHLSISMLDINIWLDQHILSLYIAAGAIYISVLVWKSKSPILLFWQWFGYKSKENIASRRWSRDFLIWSLHLVIFYAFGRTIFGFLQGNINAILDLIWPDTHFSWNQWFVIFHLPKPRVFTLNQLFEISCLAINYALFSITILGCLLGYGYSVLCYLFGKRIRNLDFTVMGWLTNAVCYGPLLGYVVWRMVPPLMGSDPTITQGPLWYLTSVMIVLLNLFYSISIWNLGTMFGLMTDKGVRTSGFYSVIRHPSYTLEAFLFLMMGLNGLSTFSQWIAVSMYFFIYYVRSEREDQFMAQSNLEYKIYQQKTPYKFIPGIY